MTHYAAIDFGTSNSALCVRGTAGPVLVPLEGTQPTLPTALFFNSDENRVSYGRTGIAEYEAGYGGRLMRSLKSLLGSELMNETTLVNGRPLSYAAIIGHFLTHLKTTAEASCGASLTRAVLGRPVFFVDDNPERDRLAQRMLEDIARETGFSEVCFQYEPIAAALDYETELTHEALALVVDIGGGTSDFTVIRLGPERAPRLDRSEDVLANGGVHLAGTDFDRQLSLNAVMPLLGFGGVGPTGKPVPSHTYFELATWHKINFLYTARALAEAQTLRDFFADRTLHQRLMTVLRNREGHRLAGLVETAKVGASETGSARIALDFVEDGLDVTVDTAVLSAAVDAALAKITATALQAVADAGLTPADIDAVYFTGGSTRLAALRQTIAAAFPSSAQISGDAFASVARGLGAYAARVFA